MYPEGRRSCTHDRAHRRTSLVRSAQYFAAGLCQPNQSWFRAPPGPMTTFSFFQDYLRVLIRGLLIDERRGPTTTVDYRRLHQSEIIRISTRQGTAENICHKRAYRRLYVRKAGDREPVGGYTGEHLSLRVQIGNNVSAKQEILHP
jgi:hypothetical protein